jgi:RHS repeat-associated protein
MVVSETRNGVESDYISDTLGSTIGLMGSAGTMTDRWEYWPYGEVVSRTGTSVTPLTFLGVLGYFQDVLSKLFYVRARHLRVDIARWLTVDPIWPNESPYSYANGKAVSISDPYGLSSQQTCLQTAKSNYQQCISQGFVNYAKCSSKCDNIYALCMDTCPNYDRVCEANCETILYNCMNNPKNGCNPMWQQWNLMCAVLLYNALIDCALFA